MLRKASWLNFGWLRLLFARSFVAGPVTGLVAGVGVAMAGRLPCH
ncbi:hypothetical protein SAMN05660745_01963 [Corynebacterium glucuronolyticum]|nr:hypothetical protein CGLUCO_10540 [Corynebacterium glucuronolyticum DSM 44120]SMB78479.1 hypothetical protein SAMN05660745_01963 [Corynebacterium glucuronolyticum]